MAFRVLRLDHVVLRVANREASLAFYCGALGCRIERDRPDIGLIQLRAGDSQIDLVLGKGSPTADAGFNVDHFCIRIEPFEETAIRNHLAGYGVDTGPIAPRFGADGTGPSIYVKDPDGNTVELKGPPFATG